MPGARGLSEKLRTVLEEKGYRLEERNGRLVVEAPSNSFSLVDLGREALEALLELDGYEKIVVVLEDNYYLYFSRSDVEKALKLLEQGEKS